MQQQPFQLPPQQPNLNSMAYTPIAKLDNFTNEEDDSLAVKPQTFNEFKTEFLRYFSNNNSINCLTNTFTTIKQGDTKAVTTYLEHFHRNLHQIQTIQADYFIVPQILNQFIRGLRIDLPTAVTHTRDFEAAELEAYHAQAVNLVINRSSDLDSKLKQFTDNHAIYQSPQQHNNSENTNHFQNQPHPLTLSSLFQKCMFATTVVNKILDSESLPKSRPISNHLPANDTATNLSTASISTSNLSTAATGNLLAAAPNNLSQNLGTGSTQNPNSQNYLSLLVTPKDATTNNSESNPPQTTLINNIPPATVTENKSLTAIFSFKLEETINPPLFSEAALEKKLITAMYIDVKVDGYSIKLILDSELVGSIITRQLMDQLGHRVDRTASTRIITANGATKTPIREIDNFSIEVNSIIVPIKNTQELQFSQNGQHIQVPATLYQVSWANVDYNELPSIFIWDNNDNEKKKQRKKSIWEATINAWTDNNQSEMPPILDWEKKNKEKGKGKEENISEETTTAEEITSGWEREYSCEPIKEPSYIPLKCKDCEKKLCKSITIASPAIENDMTTQKDKTKMWNDIPGQKGMCDTLCQYMILITISHLNGYPHDKDKIWQMANAKVEGALPSEILEIKNNSLEPTDIVLVFNPNAFINLENSPKEFYEHYQNLAPIREEQKQCLEKINTQLCDHCLIPYDFQFCDDCDFIYNPPLCMIYMIPEEEEPINSYASELELSSNSNLNSNNDDNKNNDSSSVQNGYNNDNDSNSDSNSDSNYKQYITLSDLIKEQELK
ncbi:hypothetical protein G9A89_018606 [Geosiphon pyriformis]|nr:hypothetical protein G9A89_018606 [Geosiphon pyriformis]